MKHCDPPIPLKYLLRHCSSARHVELLAEWCDARNRRAEFEHAFGFGAKIKGEPLPPLPRISDIVGQVRTKEQLYAAALKKYPTKREAALALGVNEATLYRFLKKNRKTQE